MDCLTKNEKKTLKLLLSNSRMSDSEIASKLNISSQAVGKIRRKLESSIIESYTLDLNYSKIGIQIFAIAITKITQEGLNLGELEVEQKLLNNPSVIRVYRIPKGSSTHIILYGFQDMTELDDFFHSAQVKQELHTFIEVQELFTFSHNSLVKDSPTQLFHKAIESLGTKIPRIKFDELEKFKKRL